MPVLERNVINVETGSSFNCPVICVHCGKQHLGVLHAPHSHTTRFFVQIIEKIREFRNDREWCCYLRGFLDHLETLRGEIRESMDS